MGLGGDGTLNGPRTILGLVTIAKWRLVSILSIFFLFLFDMVQVRLFR